jgi:hypothetical protein
MHSVLFILPLFNEFDFVPKSLLQVTTRMLSDVRTSWCASDPSAELSCVKFSDGQSMRPGQG